MKRKKTEETPEEFWPVPGVDGEPYPPRVQEALDLVAKETLRRKRAECQHLNRTFKSRGRSDYGYGEFRYDRVCEECGLIVSCEHPENGLHRANVRYTGSGFLEYWKCNCGELIARCIPDRPRQTRTEWLKTEEQERREARQLKQAAERRTPHERGALRKSVAVSSAELDRERIRQRNLVRRAARQSLPSVLSDPEGESLLLLRNALGEPVVMVPTEDRAPDLGWVRTMQGKERL